MRTRWFFFAILLLSVRFCFAATTGDSGDYDPVIFLWLVIFIFLSRSFSVVKKIGLPIVVGEILAGIILGDLHMFGINFIQNAENNVVIKFIAELGAIILMFEIGIESKFSDLRRNFKTGVKLAVTGSIFTFSAGYLISRYVIPHSNISLDLLIGTICAATATGISAKAFKDMRILGTKEVKIVLVASVIDELVSIIAFAIISAMVMENAFNLMNLSLSILQVVGFFIFTIIFGRWIAPWITTWSTKIHAGINMKVGVLFVICLFFAWLAHVMGLATVVGAFIAGLILDEMYFKSFSKSSFFRHLRGIASQIQDEKLRDHLHQTISTQEERTLEELLKPISHIFVPVFFIYIGMMLDISALFNYRTLFITMALVIASFIGRIISGYLVRGKNLNKLIIGLGMTPIGEAGLIFAMFGKNLGLINNTVFTSVVSALVIAAITTPILIKLAIFLNTNLKENTVR
jgi:Kef-type K+ transport system membrane component KefB